MTALARFLLRLWLTIGWLVLIPLAILKVTP